MRTWTNTTGIDPFENPADRLLAEIALSIQLPPSLHAKAEGRYEAVRRHLESKDKFTDQVEIFYPQGSMAIDATIATRGTDDEYDLDIVAQLGGNFRNKSPLEILTDLEEGLRDYPVEKVVRQTRCVTLQYADNMHLDVTPALRHYGTPDRQGVIAHAKGPSARPDDRLVDMNAYGFNEWYRELTPIEDRVAKSFQQRWLDRDMELLAKSAEVDDVPDQTHFGVKNTATLALQLIKRFRNVVYADYSGRIPPSILLSYFAALMAAPNRSLSEIVVLIARRIASEIENASLFKRKLHVTNPRYVFDVLTDRWPENLRQQDEFAVHLKRLADGVEKMRRKEWDPAELRDWLRTQFGDRVVTKAADRFADDIGTAVRNSTQVYTKTGGVLLPKPALVGGAALSTVASSVAAAPHTFYGDLK
jgi:hypothetical protein